MIRLSELPAGQKAIIREFEPITNSSVSYQDTDWEGVYLRLMEMGCVSGQELTIVNIAPFGGPISIAIAGRLLSLRAVEAQWIWVEKIVKKVRAAY